MPKPGLNAYLQKRRRRWYFTKRHEGERLIIPLKTEDVVVARKRRDELLAQLTPTELPSDPFQAALEIRARLPDHPVDYDEADAVADHLIDKGESPETVRKFLSVARGHATLLTDVLDGYCKELRVAPATVQKRKFIVELLANEYGIRTLEELTPVIAGKIVSKWAASELHPTTVNNRIHAAASLWTYAIKRRLLGNNTQNPWHHLTIPVREAVGSEAWSIDEIAQAIVCLEPEASFVVELLAYTGARLGEIANVEIEGEHLFIPKGKTPASRRRVYPPERLVRKLKRQGGRVYPEFSGDRVTQIGSKIGPAVHELFPQWQREGYRRRTKTLHGIRSTFVTIARQEGFSQELIGRAVGHVDRHVTFSVYGKTGPSERQLREVFEAVANVLDRR